MISLHIQDAGYKSSTARFSSRPGGYKETIDRKNINSITYDSIPCPQAQTWTADDDPVGF